MAKRRFNDKKIANTPSLKKRIARYCAEYDVKWTKIDAIELLYKGNRGYISMSEDSLGKEFDKKFTDVQAKFDELHKVEQEDSKKSKWYRPSNTYVDLTAFREEGISIGNEIFEEVLLK